MNKTCYACAASYLSRTIRLRIRVEDCTQYREDPQQLATKVSSWHAMLERHAAHRHARYLKVSEYRKPSFPAACRPSHLDLLDSDDEFAEAPRRPLRMPSDSSHMTYSTEVNDLWPAVARPIESLPALHELHYGCSYPLPPCIAYALRQSKFEVNLHLGSFWFTDYLGEGKRNPEKLSILPSPQLRSIRTRSKDIT